MNTESRQESPQESRHESRHESRITELEIKASFMEDTVEQLNEVIVRQQRQIELLARELSEQRDRMPEGGPGQASLRDELPPHY